MPSRYKQRSTCILFTCAVLGLAFASILYVTLPEILLPHPKAKLFYRLTGILVPLTLAFLFGFSDLRLLSLSCLVLLRFFSLTLICYAHYTDFDLKFFTLLLTQGIEGLLFLSFCRLSCLFGCTRRKKKRFTLQFVGDYLFFCGICTLIVWLFSHRLGL